MELILILLSGAIAGLAAGAFNGVVAPIFLKTNDTPLWRERRLAMELGSVLMHLLAGIALALLFWLSWGLTAIVSVKWWERGLCFALLTWIALAVPLLANQMLHARMSWRLIAKSAWDWLLTCVLVGLACAWRWSNGR